jgi:DNA mismatch repair protein MutL
VSSQENEPGAVEIRRVRPLPDALIDQIAAGEVVERPASVVKELVENALDAGARRVRVEVRSGGRDWIAVTDDGCGMGPEDARLALQRHATSKVASADDLQRIATYGFRGEALPAIASVSKLRLRTRTAGAEEAFEIRVEEGRLVEERAAAGAVGTRIEVADLFSSVPARRKFLKTVNTEWGHIADWLARAALALPGVHFEIRRDDRPALVWPAASDLLDRVAAVLGEPEAAAFVPVERWEGAAGVSGFVSRPDRHRASMAGIHLFVNQRPVRDRLVQHALVEVYRDVLPRGRFPSAVLFLDVPTESVDVNVHPAKWEVRFADPQWIHRLIRHAVREAIGERRWIAPEQGAGQGAPGLVADRPGAPASGAGVSPPAGGGSDWVFAGVPASAPPTRETALPGFAAEEPELRGDARVRFGELPLLGQLLATYLVLEAKDRLLLVDQHAAHERVLFERLRAEWREGAVESQGLLVPVSLPMAPEPLRALTEGAEGLSGMGFEIEAFGEDTAVVRAVPALLGERDPATLVRDLADELVEAGPAADALRAGTRQIDAADRIFANLACRSARMKGDVLDPREQQALLDALDAIPWAPTCPHGRPVAVPFDLAEIERRFGRR